MWAAQVTGWAIPVTTLCSIAARTGVASYIATVTIMFCAAFAYVWRMAERILFLKALRS
jgi:hypothetical protein